MRAHEPKLIRGSELDDLIEDLADRVTRSGGRFVLGITGPPGSGKSSLAQRVASAVAAPAAVAPMDGFHLSNEELERVGLLALKGIPDSFDGEAFVARLVALRSDTAMVWPTFDRDREAVVAAGLRIDAECRLVVVEGNYLLLHTPPWDAVRPLLDEVWYLDVPELELVERLESRHGRYRSPADAAAKVRSTDLPNARLVASVRERADVVVSFR